MLIGYSLYQAQLGGFPDDAKPLKGFNGVIEIISKFDKNTYRAVYATKLGERIYVLNVFQKKSKSGISIPREDMQLIKQTSKFRSKLFVHWELGIKHVLA